MSIKSLPEGHTFRVSFNSKPCGRCGGTGKYHIGGISRRTGICYKCNGTARLRSSITQKHRDAFAAYMDGRPKMQCGSEANARAQASWKELHSGKYGRAFIVTIRPIPPGK
jgi:DnaJ-class molecular chaperone